LEELRKRTDLRPEEEQAARDAIIEAQYQARIAANAAFAAEVKAAENARAARNKAADNARAARNQAALNAVANYSSSPDRRARIAAAMRTHPK
jgi:hypothetical protein